MAGPSTPAELVTDAYDQFFGFAQQSFNTANQILGAIITFDAPFVTTNVSFKDTTQLPKEYRPPLTPTAPDVNIGAPSLPQPPTLGAVPAVSLQPAPTYNREAPVLALPARPAALNTPAPGDSPSIGNYTVPEAPTLEYPDVPVPREIILADTPQIDEILFERAIPTIDGIVLPEVSVELDEQPYRSASLDQIQTAIARMLAGSPGFFDPDVENALYARARARISTEARQARQDAFEQWSARGFAEPGGELSARLDQVRQREQNESAVVSREILERVHQAKLENLRAALSAGVQLESTLLNIAQQIAQRALDAKALTLRAAVELFNARVSLYNAQIQGFQAEAEVFRTRIEAEKTKVDTYRVQIEAAKTVNEINQVDAQIYAERVRALVNTVSVYEATVRGFTARVEADKARVEAFRATIQGYAERVNAKKAEFEAYGEEVRAQTAITGAYQAETAAFGERVRAYTATVQSQNDTQRLQIDRNRLAVEAYQSQLQAFREQVNAATAAAQQAIALYDGQSRVYSAQVSAEAARVESGARTFTASIERSRTEAQIAIENARINSENANRAAERALEALKSAGTISAQVAAGALSAVSMSASISGSTSGSTNVSYTVDGGSSPPPIGLF